MIIAVDGPAASGKGTLARLIARQFGLYYLDTGSLYRAVARDALAARCALDDAGCLARIASEIDADTLDDPHLRDRGVGEAASIVAGLPDVRAALLDFQRAFAARDPGAVLDGRDIGTVVCPNSDAKLFITADVEIRARRRFNELEARGEDVTFEDILTLIKNRDARDAGRDNAPMRIAEDADLLDTTDLGIEAAFDAAVGLIKRKISQPGA